MRKPLTISLAFSACKVSHFSRDIQIIGSFFLLRRISKNCEIVQKRHVPHNENCSDKLDFRNCFCHIYINKSKNAQAECKVKACFQTLLRRSRCSRRNLKDRISPNVLKLTIRLFQVSSISKCRQYPQQIPSPSQCPRQGEDEESGRAYSCRASERSSSGAGRA